MKNERIIVLCFLFLFLYGATAPSGSGARHCQGFTITLRHTTLDSTPLDTWSARRRDLYLTTHNRQTYMPPARFEHAIPARERQQTHALVSEATGIGLCCDRHVLSSCFTSLYTPITFLIDTICLSTLCDLDDIINKKVNQSHYRPGVAQMVPGS